MLISPRRLAGFSLIELLVTISMVGIMLAIGVPALGKWNADARVRSTAESLTNTLRVAQAAAISRNRTSTFVLTAAQPTYNSTPSTTGSNWFVSLIPSTDAGETAAALGTIQTSTIASQNGVTINSGTLNASPVSVVCFNSIGRQVTLSSAGCTAPTSDASPTVFTVSRTDATRSFKVLVSLGGRVRMCDKAKSLATSPDGCP